MRRFRRTSGFRGRLPREPVFWVRRHVQYTTGDDAHAAVRQWTLFDFNTLAPVGYDQQFTIRKVIFDYAITLGVVHGALVAGDIFPVGFGIGVLDAGAGAPDPLLAAGGDQDFDWMWLGAEQVTSDAADHTYSLGHLWPPEGALGLVVLRTQRKVHQSSHLSLLVKVGNPPTGNAMTSAALRGDATVSLLLERTMRRK